jgi:hypothetical protein
MSDNALALALDSLPGFLLLGGFTFILTFVYLWSTSRKPTRFAALRYRMLQDRVPKIILVILILIGLFLIVLAIIDPDMLILIVPTMALAFSSAFIVHGVVTWAAGVQGRDQTDKAHAVASPQSAESNSNS